MKRFTRFLFGFAFLMLGVGCVLMAVGKSKMDKAVFEFEPDYNGDMLAASEKIDEVLIDVPYGYVMLKTTDAELVTYGMENTEDQEIEIKEAAGCFSIRCESVDIRTEMDAKDFKTAFEMANDKKLPTYCIGVPKDYAGSIRILLATGQISVENVRTEEFNAVLNCGEIVLKDVEVETADLVCNVGRIRADGDFTERLAAHTDVGVMELELDGKEKDYWVDAECEVGRLVYDGRLPGGFSLTKLKDRKGAVLSLQVEVGSLEVDFN